MNRDLKVKVEHQKTTTATITLSCDDLEKALRELFADQIMPHSNVRFEWDGYETSPDCTMTITTTDQL